jgi:hypothetical protein
MGADDDDLTEDFAAPVEVLPPARRTRPRPVDGPAKSFGELQAIAAWQREVQAEAQRETLGAPLVANRAAAPPAPRVPAEPPHKGDDLGLLVQLWLRRTREIMIDAGVGFAHAKRQAFSNAVNAYRRRYGGELEDAARILRPITIDDPRVR